jgi:hypothetical protein
MIPKRSKRLLPGNFSQEALNTKLLSGEIRGLRAPAALHTFPAATNPKRAWRVRPTGNLIDEYWISSQYPEAELLKCPLINDGFDRWYLFEPGQTPKVNSMTRIIANDPFVPIAFTQPSTAPTLAATPGSGPRRDVVYVYTYVTEWGEESRPSPPAVVNVDDGGAVLVSNFYTPMPTITGRAFSKVRIYRTVSFYGAAALFFVAEINWAVANYNDTRKDALVSLNETLPSVTFDPPISGLYGARVHPSGALVAFKGREVYFSEPYRPHAWPEDYRLSVEDEIVGIEVWEQNVGVFTRGRPYLVYGQTPDQTGLLRYPMSEPCVSYGSIVGAPEGAYYVSDQGLVLFNNNGPKNLTRELISEEEWANAYLSDTTSAARYGTQYVAIEDTNAGFIIDGQETRIALTDLAFELPFVSFDEDYYSGRIFGVAGDVVYEFDPPAGDEIDWIWKSKQFLLPMPVNFGAVMVHIEPRAVEYVPGGPLPSPPFDAAYDTIDKTTQVLVEIFQNDERVFVGPAGDREQVRLPSGTMGDAYEIRITGQCRLYSVALTETGKGHARAG